MLKEIKWQDGEFHHILEFTEKNQIGIPELKDI